jgi:uncharacterized protein
VAAAADVDVRDAPDRNRYEVELDGGVAVLDYLRADGVIALLHTEVPDAHEGEGVGSALARFALEDARSRGERVDNRCAFVAGWMERHPGYEDLLA